MTEKLMPFVHIDVRECVCVCVCVYVCMCICVSEYWHCAMSVCVGHRIVDFFDIAFRWHNTVDFLPVDRSHWHCAIRIHVCHCV